MTAKIIRRSAFVLLPMSPWDMIETGSAGSFDLHSSSQMTSSNWTPEQRAEIERQKQEGRRRIMVKETPEQEAGWRAMADVENTPEAIAANIALLRKVEAAAEEEGFSGWLRRGITRARRPIHQIAESAKIDIRLLQGFRTGEVELSTDAVDRLIRTLGLKLVEETA